MARHAGSPDLAAPASGALPITPDGPRARLLAGLPLTDRRLSLNGVHTAVLEGGDGPPLVLLHGPGAYGLQWLRVLPGLLTTHRVVAPDLPGHGESGPLVGAADLDLVSGWLDDLIECTCPTPPVLVGHTLGGAIAAGFAAERGERLAALVLVDTLGLTEFRPAHEFGVALNEYLSAPGAQTLDRLWGECLFDLPAARSGMGELWDAVNAYNLDRVLAPGRLAALLSLMARFGTPAIPAEVLASIAVPTTLIWGRHDRATPLSVAEEASRRFRWPLEVIEGAADDPALERPDAFLDALRAQLESAGRRAQPPRR
jgi:pimeloyl-ACP methyl ester carboxylesterase